MLTDQDIQNLTDKISTTIADKIIEVQKEVFPTKADFGDLRKDFSTLQNSVDRLVKKIRYLSYRATING